MGVIIQIDDGDAIKLLKNAPKEILDNANKAVVKAGFYVGVELKESIAGNRAEPKSWDTGFFINSILPIFPQPWSENACSPV